MKKLLFIFIMLGYGVTTIAQEKFTLADELRGSITPQRAWWDLQHYSIEVDVFAQTKSLSGTNTITYRVLSPNSTMQIDLQEPMRIDLVTQNGEKIEIESIGNAHFLDLKQTQEIGAKNKVTIHFSGIPREALNAPWDGGLVWSKDSNGIDFIASANQGIGASVWWPVKDHPQDEPDNGVDLFITTPKDLVGVGNGRLIEEIENKDTKTWHWQVVNPINSYGVNINVGDYVTFSETYNGLNGKLDLSYWVLRDNLEIAKEQFKQAPLMLEAFEYWFGPYPFYEDSFKLVEAPYLGMEHQSSVTYGNKYKNGYLGRDLSGTGWGLEFDFIIIHEAGHEWFANNITNKDVADMWIHEGFTAYSENLYLNYHFGKKAASEYVIGTKRSIQNDTPLIGTYNRNNRGSNDMYYKGANILHTLRQLLADDQKWRAILQGLNKDFYHQTVTSHQVETYISEKSGIHLTQFWEQYLRTTMIPNLQYTIKQNKLNYRYTDIIKGFDMPVQVKINGVLNWIQPTSAWKTLENNGKIKTLDVQQDFLINSSLIEKP
ncbi:M1 family metallopeptidase [Flavobacteriaceae bacterium]|nr:M1 family metallopeptidase [Flavobacteriaceae bacterium]MDA9283772.1 M1 family metallopeptidase [Flavobacteriaceae bacterium]